MSLNLENKLKWGLIKGKKVRELKLAGLQAWEEGLIFCHWFCPFASLYLPQQKGKTQNQSQDVILESKLLV